MKRADQVHYLATTVLMFCALGAAESLLLGAVIVVAYFVSIAAGTWLYCDAQDKRWAADDVRAVEEAANL